MCCQQGYEKPSVMHATVVIFLEFFAWGLLTSPTIQVGSVCVCVCCYGFVVVVMLLWLG